MKMTLFVEYETLHDTIDVAREAARLQQAGFECKSGAVALMEDDYYLFASRSFESSLAWLEDIFTLPLKRLSVFFHGEVDFPERPNTMHFSTHYRMYTFCDVEAFEYIVTVEKGGVPHCGERGIDLYTSNVEDPSHPNVLASPERILNFKRAFRLTMARIKAARVARRLYEAAKSEKRDMGRIIRMYGSLNEALGEMVFV